MIQKIKNYLRSDKIGLVRLTIKLAINDYKQKYAASALGIFWGFFPSLMTIIIYWFVFSIGFKISSTSEPYLLWLISGLIPWFFFADGLANITNSFVEYSYLVKKVVFNISILPHVKAISASINHFFFLILMFFLLLAYGYLPGVYTLQLVYYILCLYLFTIAIGRITSIFNVFFRDISSIVAVFLQFGVWTVPILWQTQSANFSSTVISILKINPLFYIILGYRDSLLYQTAFLSQPFYTLYFWFITLGLLLLGRFLQRKMQGHFADLL